MISPSLARRLVAEGVGTAGLLIAIVGAGLMAQQLAGEAAAVRLLVTALPTGGALFCLITVLGPVSGAHINPAISLAFALQGSLRWRTLPAYIGVQILGGIAGTALAHLMFAEPLLQTAATERAGAALLVSEALATFGLAAVILLGLHWRAGAVPALVGVYIASAYWFTASTSFANPAVTLARTLTDSFTGIAWISAPGFVLAQCVGAALAVPLCAWLTSEPGQRTG
jgi:glycerol uptake facilitator-like aquaporin